MTLKFEETNMTLKIYQGVCDMCKQSYIGETKRNVEVRWAEQNNPNGKSEPANRLAQNPSHSFSWKVLLWKASKIYHRLQNH